VGSSTSAASKGISAAAAPPLESKKTSQAARVPPPPPNPPQLGENLPPPIATAPGEAAADSDRRRSMVSFLVSALVHAGCLILLALTVFSAPPGTGSVGSLILAAAVDQPDLATEPLVSIARVEPGLRKPDAQLSPLPAEIPDVSPFYEVAEGKKAPFEFGASPLRSEEWGQPVGGMSGAGLEGRSPEARSRLAGDGGTDASEAAVERGLWWLAAHQRKDGSWSFDHREGLCRGLCRNPGSNTSSTAATALALAPFLGAGYTHQNGQHRQTVERGLYYLRSRAMVTSNGIDLQEGTMYAQGLAAIVLCEAYAMTGDESIKDVAQGALGFIEYAQDPKGGGWRYNPGQPGDTTVTGWQLMALKSGQMAGLHVKSPTVLLVNRFLDSVESEDGARYGYLDRTARLSTTAIGLLCRMYLGWPRSHPGLQEGVRYLDQSGPSPDDMYYNYYATQVLHHWQGSEWKRWNDRMRDTLVATQAGEGHEAGSWYFDHKHAKEGGRLYNTALAIMTLEVYYRYMPLYRESWQPQ